MPDHLLYGTVLCLTEWASGDTAQCAYFGSSLEPSWLFRGSCAVWVTQHRYVYNSYSGAFCQGYARRTLNHQESYFNNTRYQPSPWHEKANKARPSIVFLRTVTTCRVEKFCVDFKIINTFHIHIHILYINCSCFTILEMINGQI